MNSEKSPDSFSNKILRYFKKDEQESIRDIWERSSDADQADQIQISSEEKELAYSDILSRIDNNSVAAPSGRKISLIQRSWFRAAAIFFIIILGGIAFLSIPIEVESGFGEFRTISLPDGSEVTLNSGTALAYNRLFGFSNRDLNLEGEAFFDVKSDDLAFTVATHNAEIRVTGTRFNVRSRPGESDQTIVDLQEGSLEFYAAENRSEPVLLRAGQGSVVTSGADKPADPELITPDKAFAWLENRFSFENRPIFQIIREIERRYAMNIAVNQRDILDDTLTIYYNNQVDAEQIVRDISQAKALNYREVNGGYVIE